MIYEYRVYEAVPGKLEEVHARFRDHTVKIFERCGMKNVGYWTADVGGSNHSLYYIIAFQDHAQRARAWAAFRKDPEWLAVKAETEANGPIVTKVFNRILAPTDYSPMQ